MLKKNLQAHNNDCFRAAASCILGCDMDELPNNKGGVDLAKLKSPRSRWQQWAKRNGYEIRMGWRPPDDKYYIGNYNIAGHTMTVHSVVCYNGEVIHNPARNSYPLRELYYSVWFERID